MHLPEDPVHFLRIRHLFSDSVVVCRNRINELLQVLFRVLCTESQLILEATLRVDGGELRAERGREVIPAGEVAHEVPPQFRTALQCGWHDLAQVVCRRRLPSPNKSSRAAPEIPRATEDR